MFILAFLILYQQGIQLSTIALSSLGKPDRFLIFTEVALALLRSDCILTNFEVLKPGVFIMPGYCRVAVIMFGFMSKVFVCFGLQIPAT